MAEMFEFQDMLQYYETDIQIIVTPTDTTVNGGYDEETGAWKGSTATGPEPIETRGVLLPYSANEIYQSGGRLTQKSRQLIINKDIPSKAIVVDIKKMQKYSVEDKPGGYEDFADFSQYELKWVSAFD